MRITIQFLIGSLFLFLVSCKPDPVDEFELGMIELNYQDSIPLFNDSITYPYFNLEKIEQDSILAFNYPSLNLYLLNRKGEIQGIINKKGDLKGEFKNIFIEPLWGPDGKLYVLEQGSSSRLSVFDQEFNFEYALSPFQEFNEYFLTLITSSSAVFPKGGSMNFISSVSNTLYSPYTLKFYEEMSSLGSFQLQDGAIKNVTFELPYKDFSTIQKAMDKRKKSWDSPHINFDVWQDKIYAKYEFDDKVYVYDLDLNPIKELSIHPEFQTDKVSVPLEKPDGSEKRLSYDFLLRFGQPYYYSISVKDNKAFLLYAKPASKDQVPKSIAEERDFISIPVLHVIDLETQEEYSVELGNKIDPYARIHAQNANEIYLLGNTKLTEDIYLYQIKLAY